MNECGADTAHGGKCRIKSAGTCWIHSRPTCSVCTNVMVTCRTLPCGHSFHESCINRWKRQCRNGYTCPNCRAPFDVPSYKCKLTMESTTELVGVDFIVPDATRILNYFRITNTPGVAPRFSVLFDVEQDESIDEVLAQMGVPIRGLSSRQSPPPLAAPHT